MRILYVTNESPILPVGGIGTYIGYSAAALRAAGHEVFLLTWTYGPADPDELTFDPFEKGHVRILTIEGAAIWKRYPDGPYNHALAQYLMPEIEGCVDEWDIDVVEAADFLSPALAFFQKVQTGSRRRDLLCVTYNHGFIKDFYDADQIRPSREVQDDLVGERQQCRISDLVVTPSIAAMLRLADYGIRDNVTLVREPFRFDRNKTFRAVSPAVTYLGRISISKGIDKLVHFTNVIHEVLPIESVLLIGKQVPTPFRTYDVQDYVRRRIHRGFRDKIWFAGQVPRSAALRMLEAGDISPSLGSAETFSYACVESIDAGLLPIVRAGTPMAEFFPEDLQQFVFAPDLADARAVQRRFEAIAAAGPDVVARLQEFNAVELSPERIAGEMSDAYDRASRAKAGMRSVLVRERAKAGDVTALMPVYRPDLWFQEAIDSIASQTAGAPKLIVCDDGTPEADLIWFEYARLRLPDVRIIRQPNTGLLGARNALIREAETRLAVFLDADDILHPCYLERTLEAYNASPLRPEAVLTHRQNFGESHELVIRDFAGDHVHLLRNDFRMTALIETEILREIGFDATRRNGEGDDWVFWLEFDAAGYRSVLVPEPLFQYRFRSGSMSWPWSEGQTAGTHSMVRQAIASMARQRPQQGWKIARAMFSLTTVK